MLLEVWTWDTLHRRIEEEFAYNVNCSCFLLSTGQESCTRALNCGRTLG